MSASSVTTNSNKGMCNIILDFELWQLAKIRIKRIGIQQRSICLQLVIIRDIEKKRARGAVGTMIYNLRPIFHKWLIFVLLEAHAIIKNLWFVGFWRSNSKLRNRLSKIDGLAKMGGLRHVLMFILSINFLSMVILFWILFNNLVVILHHDFFIATISKT